MIEEKELEKKPLTVYVYSLKLSFGGTMKL